MEVVVVFCYRDISDVDGQDADAAIATLEHRLKAAGIACDSWAVVEALSDEEDEHDT